jgi:hypothetical protein
MIEAEEDNSNRIQSLIYYVFINKEFRLSKAYTVLKQPVNCSDDDA